MLVGLLMVIMVLLGLTCVLEFLVAFCYVLSGAVQMALEPLMVGSAALFILAFIMLMLRLAAFLQDYFQNKRSRAGG